MFSPVGTTTHMTLGTPKKGVRMVDLVPCPAIRWPVVNRHSAGVCASFNIVLSPSFNIVMSSLEVNQNRLHNEGRFRFLVNMWVPEEWGSSARDWVQCRGRVLTRGHAPQDGKPPTNFYILMSCFVWWGSLRLVANVPTVRRGDVHSQ